jgi:uncharacterized protein YaaQ
VSLRNSSKAQISFNGQLTYDVGGLVTSSMKLVIAIVQDYDTDRLLRGISEAGLRATRIASTGGFLRMGNTTVFLGVSDDQVSTCLSVLEQACKSRIERMPAELVDELGYFGPGTVTEVTTGGAVVFVVPVSRFVRIEWANDGAPAVRAGAP